MDRLSHLPPVELGFARIPEATLGRLRALAEAAAAAAAGLEALTRSASRPAEVTAAAAQARRLARDAVEDGALLRAGGVDPADLLRLARALAAACVRAAEAAGAVAGQAPLERWRPAVAVARDLAREQAAAVGELNGAVEPIEARLERMDQLLREARTLRRGLRADLVVAAREPLALGAALEALLRVERTLAASAGVVAALRLILLRHRR